MIIKAAIGAVGLAIGAASFANTDQLPNDTCKVPFDNTPVGCFPGAISAGSSENSQGFRNYAVKQFYALNWPVTDISSREPDLSKNPAPFDISVWQTWQTKTDLTKGSKPVLTAQNKQEIADILKSLNIAQSQTFAKHLEYLHDTDIPDQDHQPLVAIDKSKLHFEVYYNDVAVNDLSNFAKNNYQFTTGSTSDAKRGAIVAKGAWRVIPKSEYSTIDQFHTSLACIYSDTNTCNIQVVGLAGLHIANKMNPLQSTETKCEGLTCKNIKISEWSWTTFEHYQNAPSVASKSDFSNIDKTVSWLLYDNSKIDQNIKNCTEEELLALDNANCVVNQIPKSASTSAQIIRFQPSDRNFKVENLSEKVCKGSGLSSLDYSSCLTILAYTETPNVSPLQNYRLIENVWVDTRGNILPAYSGKNAVDKIIRNSSMEPFDRSVSQDNLDCAACHRHAKYDGMFTVPSIIKGDK
ncbi:hypothetical protein N474_17190 [Pseudoalteromonas luteoviolacea CPMOR-2]|uniref:Cytochrome c domain-containing protein n=1 Tax=Pseudoalteromonas luteoviolacea DSM 6061 TaxID=1365250 RepID=A0A166UDH7_9GAMM|nr:hypothetical protein [Pseudoalteromonas luteoviolacea]KZN29832.1 hypothetical protein N475_25305 [Pseudoalteromonas luteoviolacea DSM 6061]KZN54805.1 hypothetical protein N474_17190 [Pseudoalteromonas luteoviolacea CPMOR-2]MBE0389670.1 hypothetical protein [Pseudoalteromonas luteoviolacea DSM 6061]